MNRKVYVLLAVGVLASVVNAARAETMAERKQRIMRKYLRERQDIAQSDLIVPDTSQDDTRITESEKFLEPQVAFQRQEGGVAPPPAARPAPVQAERSWWLDTAEIEDDPFSSGSDTEDQSRQPWSPWGRGEDSSASGRSAEPQGIWRQGDSFLGSRSGYDALTEGDNATTASSLTYGGYTSRWSTAREGMNRMSGRYGYQQTENRAPSSGWSLNPANSYGSSPSSGLLYSPFPTPTTTPSGNTQNQVPGYTPYTSPFQSERDEQGRNRSNLQPQQPEYSRPQPYQKWKDKNKTWDPTKDDSYLDALMQDKRR